MLCFKTLTLVSGAAALLAGCNPSLDEARRITPSGSAFSKALHAGYVGLAQAEMDESDIDDARLFALRARSAALGNPEPVEQVDFRRIPAPHRDTVGDARSRLIAAFGRGAKTKAANEAATAQLMYECWTQELEENFQPHDIAVCKTGFETAMRSLGSKLGPKKAAIVRPPKTPVAAKSATAPAATKASVKQVGPSALKTKFSVFFDLDNADLKASARQAIDQAVAAARLLGATVIKVSGHADRTGTETYNRGLSQRRARSVSSVMTQLDGNRRKIVTEAKGESQPAVATRDGVQEPRNRRVDIELIN